MEEQLSVTLNDRGGNPAWRIARHWGDDGFEVKIEQLTLTRRRIPLTELALALRALEPRAINAERLPERE